MVGFEGYRSFTDHFASWSEEAPVFIDSAGDAMLHDPGMSQVVEANFVIFYPEMSLIRGVKLNKKEKKSVGLKRAAVAL